MISKIKTAFYFLFIYPVYKVRFGSLGWKAKVVKPLHLHGVKNIHIAGDVIVEYKTWLAALPLTGAAKCRLEIGEGSRLGHFNHIYATAGIKIGKNVLIADKVYIADNMHAYENVTIPVTCQPVKQLKEVVIGDGAWLGENVCIIGACVGKGSIIGANSVVNKDIPDYCVAVGSPARVVKTYNFTTQQWEKYQPK